MMLGECNKLIKQEQLFDYNIYDEHEFRPNEICIRKLKHAYIVFVISERCEPMESTLEECMTESEALESLIYRLREHNRLFHK